MFGQDKKKSGFAKISNNFKTKATKAYKKGVYKAANTGGYVAGKAAKIPKVRNTALKLGQNKTFKNTTKALGRFAPKNKDSGLRTSAAASKGFAQGVTS